MNKLALPFLFSVLFALVFGLFFIPLLKRRKVGQMVLEYVAEHKDKSGTPTIGGVIFILPCALGFLLFCEGEKHLSLITLACGLASGMIGFLDDFIKVHFRRNLGLRAYQKVITQLLIGIIIGVFAYQNDLGTVQIPFSKIEVSLGKWMVPAVVFIYIVTVNSVNLTDGMDGLLSSVSIVYLLAFLVLEFAQFESLELFGRIGESEERLNLARLCALSVGGLVGYLFFNAHPAKVFMGDTGSLFLGGIITAIAVVSGKVLLIPILGVCFVISCISVILQVASFRLFKRRIFLMAPFHHHLQIKGYHENQIVVLYTIFSLCAAVLTLAFA